MAHTETWVQEYGTLASPPGPDGMPLPMDERSRSVRHLIAVMHLDGPLRYRTTRRPEHGIEQRWRLVRG